VRGGLGYRFLQIFGFKRTEGQVGMKFRGDDALM
jgi:hypothetical protein